MSILTSTINQKFFFKCQILTESRKIHTKTVTMFAKRTAIQKANESVIRFYGRGKRIVYGKGKKKLRMYVYKCKIPLTASMLCRAIRQFPIDHFVQIIGEQPLCC